MAHAYQSVNSLLESENQLCLDTSRIRVPKVTFRFFDKLKNEIQNFILTFCFYFNKEDEIQITDYHFRV